MLKKEIMTRSNIQGSNDSSITNDRADDDDSAADERNDPSEMIPDTMQLIKTHRKVNIIFQFMKSLFLPSI